MTLALEQTLNGIQFGVMLFLLAAGLTLIFGVMNVINLAHGSLLHDRRLRRGAGAANAAAHLPLPRSPVSRRPPSPA